MQLTSNTQAFIDSEQYSSFILTNMHDGLLPEMLYRDVSDFGKGETLHIKTIGSATVQEVDEDTPLVYNPISTGEVGLTISNYVGDAWYVTDVLRQDGAGVEKLMAERATESTRIIQEYHETRFLKTANEAQEDGDYNAINGFAHRVSSLADNQIAQIGAFRDMALAFDKAEVPYAGRIAIVDPVVGHALTLQVDVTQDVTEFGKLILENGFHRGHQAIMNLFGWDVIVSNRLDKGTFSDGSITIENAVANVFMCVADDNTKPIMHAWRSMPTVEGERDMEHKRDNFQATCRFGFGAQRVDSLGIYLTSDSNY